VVEAASFYTTKMYAVIKDNIIIDVGFGNKDLVKSLKDETIYTSKLNTLVEVTLENSPMQLGQKYLGDK
jgi:hypothetical protein